LSIDRLADVFVAALGAIVGEEFLRKDPASLASYGTDALQKGHPADVVVIPADTQQISSVARLCNQHRVPLIVRGAGTGYTGGAVPTSGGVVLSMERLNRILEIDQQNLLAVVEPNVITADLQRAVEQVGLFYPPDPASLEKSSLGGNVAECAGGPRAFKYGTTKRYVLALEAVLATGEILHTGSKAVKNVVGYDLTQLLVGSEGTLAIITKITLRLVPKPPARATMIAAFASIDAAVAAVNGLIERRAVPAAVELIDEDSLRAAQAYSRRTVAPAGARALLIIECDGIPAAVQDEMALVQQACEAARAIELRRAADDAERVELWTVRRDISLALRATGLLKINHDVVVPRGRVPELYAEVARLKGQYELTVAAFGHAGDGNIHVNLMVNRDDAEEMARARLAERALFERVVTLEGSISGEHGIGFAKKAYIDIELGSDEIALMKGVKAAFDPNDVLTPGNIFP
jgi:glycolate oxidase